MIPRRIQQALRPQVSSRWAAVRVVAWLVLLVGVGVGMGALVSAHLARGRGSAEDFPAPIRDANVPILGVNVHLERYSDPELTWALSHVAEGGFVWVRQSFAWCDARSDGPSDELDWSSADRLMEALSQYPELRPVAVLIDDPPEPPSDPEQFAAYAGAFAARYGHQVDVYQIWDEPNLAANWGSGPVSPSAYADLLARAARAIRAADPGAKIMLAGLAPTVETGPQNLSELQYLEQLYELGAASSFDIVAAKPYGCRTGPDDRRVDESHLNVSRVLLLREVMVANGDAETAIWASHWGWNALPEGWDGDPSLWGQVDETTQADHSVAMLERARNEWPWMGAMIIENLQPEAAPCSPCEADLENPRWGFALLDPDGEARPVYEAMGAWARAQPDAAPAGGYPVQNRWATYDKGWLTGPLGADVGPDEGFTPSGTASFRFDGTRVAVTVRRGPYPGFLYVSVDGKPANALPRDEGGRAYVVLYDERSGVATVPLAKGLEPGVHVVELTVEGAEGEWPLVDWRVGSPPVRDGIGWQLGGLAAGALLVLAALWRDIGSIRWASLAQGFLTLPQLGQAGLTVGLTGGVWAAAALSWGRAASWGADSTLGLVFSLSALPLLAFLFALRLDLGLALVAFSAPFYRVPPRMFYRSLSMPELLVALCCVAFVGRWVCRSGIARTGARGAGPHSGTEERFPDRFGPIDGGVALLASAALVATVAATDRLAALFEVRSVFLFPILYYALLRLTGLSEAERRRVLAGFLMGGLGVALIGLGQVVLGRKLVVAEGGLLRIQSVYGSPNNVGLYLGRVWPFLAAGAVLGPPGRRRRWSALSLLLVTVALVLSFSRGALLLALPVSLVVMGWWAGGRYRWVAVAAVGAGALVLIPFLQMPRFTALFDLGRGTTFFRLKLWRSSLWMVREHPLFGVGPGNFLEAYRTRYVLPAAWEEFNLEHAHNLLLDHWTRLGLLGVVAGVTLQASFWRMLGERGRSALAVGLAGSMGALLAHGLVDNALFFPDLAVAFFLTLALAQGGGDPLGDEPRTAEG